MTSPFPTLSKGCACRGRLGTSSCIIRSPSTVRPTAGSTRAIVQCSRGGLDTNITCRNSCGAFMLKFPFRSVHASSRERTLVGTILAFFGSGGWCRPVVVCRRGAIGGYPSNLPTPPKSTNATESVPFYPASERSSSPRRSRSR